MTAIDQSYFPADTSLPVLEVTAGDLLTAAAADSGDVTALVEVTPDAESLTGATSTDRGRTYAELFGRRPG
jgi:fatty-acyl-CoA synthase